MDTPPVWAFRFLFAVLCLASAVFPSAAAEPQVRELRYPDGSVKERYTYILDEKGQEIRQGLDEEFYPGGAKKGVRTWKDGRIEGAVVYFHPNGRKSYEANYVDGRKNGFATVWYMNGQKQWQTTFKGGKTHGRWREWHLDGKKKFEGDYSEGALDGRATWWHDNGRIWQERAYRAGVPVRGTVREWDRAGRQTFPPPEAPPSGFEPASADTPPEVAPPSTASKIESAR